MSFYALRLLRLRVDYPPAFVFSWGLARLALGVAMGIPIVVLYLRTVSLPPPLPYLLSFVLIRFVEWPAFFFAMTKVHRARFLDHRVAALCAIGIATSVALDFAFWKQIESIKFVC